MRDARSKLHHPRRGIARRFVGELARGRTLLLAVIAVMGPGLLAGLSDDDPAGITTYSLLGAAHGYTLLWVVVAATVLLILFHLLAVRLGVATGMGFTAAIRSEFSHHWAYVFATLFVVANVGTICAEYAGIAAITQLAGWPTWMGVLPALVVLCTLLVSSSFHRIEHVLVAVSCLLAAYVPAAFLSGVDWNEAAHGLLVPSGWGATGAATAIAATVGTTLAPWGLAFIQSYAVDKGLTPDDYRYERFDVIGGSILTGVIAVCIVLTSAATLHAAGTSVDSLGDVARALRPLAGSHATLLFSIGLLGAALLAAAIVPLATAYSVGEALGTTTGLDSPLRSERVFYGVIIGTSGLSAALVIIPGIDLVQLIFVSQVLNAVLLLPQLLMLIVLTSRRSVMGDLTIGRRMRCATGIGAGLVAACIALLLTT